MAGSRHSVMSTDISYSAHGPIASLLAPSQAGFPGGDMMELVP